MGYQKLITANICKKTHGLIILGHFVLGEKPQPTNLLCRLVSLGELAQQYKFYVGFVSIKKILSNVDSHIF